MTFKEQEQITKKNSVELLSELINFDGENIIAEILRLGIQNLMDLRETTILVLAAMNEAKIIVATAMDTSPELCTHV